jgi:hypothetical protein
MSLFIQTLRPVRVPIDQNIRWWFHTFFFTDKKQEFLIFFPSPERSRFGRMIFMTPHTYDNMNVYFNPYNYMYFKYFPSKISILIKMILRYLAYTLYRFSNVYWKFYICVCVCVCILWEYIYVCVCVCVCERERDSIKCCNFTILYI